MQRIFSPPKHMVTLCLILKELAGEKAELLLLISILHTTRSSVDELLKLSLLPKCFFSYKNVAYLVVYASRKLGLQVPQPFHWRALQLMKPLSARLILLKCQNTILIIFLYTWQS